MKLSLAGLMCVAAGCASANAFVQDDVGTTEGGVTSYSVRVDQKVNESVRALVSPAKGLLGGNGSTIECPIDVCDTLTGWINVAGFEAGRLSNGHYIALDADDTEVPSCARPGWCNVTISPETYDGTMWWLRKGADIKAVSEGLVPEWTLDDKHPRWTPSFPGYLLQSATPIHAPEGAFMGVWKRTGKDRPERLLAIFRDEAGSAIGQPYGDREVCVVATTRTPVLAVFGSSGHRGMFGYTLVLRPANAKYFVVMGYVMFPQNLECIQGFAAAN